MRWFDFIRHLKTGLVACLLMLSPATARAACDLGTVTSPLIPLAFTIENKAENIAIWKTYKFISREGGQTAITKETYIALPALQGLYTRFVENRLFPKNRCDTIKLANFETAIDSGRAFGRFEIYFEDHYCLGLRFYDPPSKPGVTKDLLSKQLASGTVNVTNVFRPVVFDGLFVIDMATEADKTKGFERVEKISELPLAGFLQDTLFIQLLQDAAAGMGEQNAWMPSLTPAGGQFMQGSGGETILVLVSKANVSAQDACRVQQERLAAGSWQAE